MENQNPSQVCYYSVAETPMGWVGIMGSTKGLKKLVLPEKRREDVLKQLNKFLQSGTKLIWAENIFLSLIEKIKDYFDGKICRFNNVKVDFSNYTLFQKNVLLRTREIPYGATRTYKWIAEQSGYPRAYRAVGGAMKVNPVPLIIPCHRVIGSQGGLTGFSATGGISLKRRMLTLEGIATSKAKL